LKTKTVWIAGLLVGLMVSYNQVMAENAAHIDINTGGKGLVPFSHQGHQTLLMDCSICHERFPQEAESILRLKNEGRLKKKEIMKGLCIQCHKDTRKAGQTSGPESCSQCHTKK